MALGVLAAVIGAAAVLYDANQKTAMALNFATDLGTLIQKVSKAYGTSTNFVGLTNTTAINDGLVPPRLVSGANLVTPWASAITLGTTDLFGDGEQSALTITVAKMPVDACATLLPLLPGMVHSVAKGATVYQATSSNLATNRLLICDATDFVFRATGS